MHEAKRLLVVSYYYPPAPGVGCWRVAKLVKYLARDGWQPTVVAADTPWAGSDPDLLADVAGVASKRVRPLREAPVLQRADWAIAAAPAVLAAARGAQVALISGGPFFPFVLGPIVRALRGVPYVLEFHDPWSFEPRFDRFRPGTRRRVGRAVEQRVEALAVRRAAAITAVTPEIAMGYARLYRSAAGRIHTLELGFDPDDFPLTEPAARREPVLLHAGTFDRGARPPDLLLATTREVRAAGVPLTVRLIGRVAPEFEGPIAEAEREGWLTAAGVVPHGAAAREMQVADVLWVEPGEQQFIVTGKVYDYLGSGRAIVAAAPKDGALAALLEEVGGGLVTDPVPEDCARAVIAALRGETPARNEDRIAELSMPQVVRRLSRLLESAHG